MATSDGGEAADRTDPAGGLAAAAALPWPGVPHGNAWAIAARRRASSSSTPASAGRGRLRQLDLALAQAGFGVEDIEPARLHPLPLRPLRPRRVDREAAGCELWMHPAWEHIRLLADDPAAALEHRLEVARQSGVPVAALERYRECPQQRRRDRHRRDPRPRPRARPRGRGGDRPRHLAGLRDPRPRPLARRPAPARAQADDLRRPPARPHRALLRLRPHARPGRRIPRQPRPRSSRSTIELCLPGHGRPFRDPEAKIAEVRAPGRRAARQGPRGRSAGGERTAFEIVAEIVGPENLDSPASAWVLQIVLSCLDHLAIGGEVSAVEGTDPQRWKLA